MLKLRHGVLKAVLGPRSAGHMPGLESKPLMLNEWTAGPGAVLSVEEVVFVRAWKSALAVVQHAILNVQKFLHL